jgi:hypothetical protein
MNFEYKAILSKMSHSKNHSNRELTAANSYNFKIKKREKYMKNRKKNYKSDYKLWL